MAKSHSKQLAASVPKSKNEDKLARLPKNAKIKKRPLMHPPIPSPFTGEESEKIVYISTKTPFMSAVKRVKQLLKHIDKRGMQSTLAHMRKSKQPKQPLVQSEEKVVIKATGKAIEKALSLGLFFQKQDDCAVKLTTSGVAAIDDIELSSQNGNSGQGDVEMKGDRDDEQAELPEARVRQASVIEIAVSLR